MPWFLSVLTEAGHLPAFDGLATAIGGWMSARGGFYQSTATKPRMTIMQDGARTAKLPEVFGMYATADPQIRPPSSSQDVKSG
jgi:hypothetical protein